MSGNRFLLLSSESSAKLARSCRLSWKLPAGPEIAIKFCGMITERRLRSLSATVGGAAAPPADDEDDDELELAAEDACRWSSWFSIFSSSSSTACANVFVCPPLSAFLLLFFIFIAAAFTAANFAAAFFPRTARSSAFASPFCTPRSRCQHPAAWLK